MSGFASIFHRDDSPPESGALEPMLTALAHRGPDGRRLLLAPPFALGHLHFWTTPEEHGERQPVAGPAGRLALFDGRLDNRRELLAALDLDGPLDRPAPSDAALALAAVDRWGSEGLERLLGPFALVICDPASRSVLCARDPLGGRSLFYRASAGRLVVASEEGAVLAHPAADDRLDERRLAGYFALRVPDDGSTFFREVSELRPGEALRVTRRQVRRWRFWRPRPLPAPRYRTDGEYAEHYRELLARSVACRLRAPGRLGVMMSGGLDSTSLAALAARHLERGGEGANGHRPPALTALSWVFDELIECDERPFIERVVAAHRLRPLRLTGDGCWPLSGAEAALEAAPEGDPPTGAVSPDTPEQNPYRQLKQGLYRRAAADGCTVVLNGGSADLLYVGAGDWLRDLLREWRLAAAGRELLGELHRHGLSRAVGRLTARRRGGGRRPAIGPPWLTSGASRLLPGPDEEALAPPAGRRPRQAGAVFAAREARGISVEGRYANCERIELRHPYRDRRLIEFMLAVPAHQLYRLGRFKHIARLAMAGLLPEAIRERRQPTRLTPLFEVGLRERARPLVERLLFGPGAAWSDFVRRDWLARVLDEGAARRGQEMVLWNCVSFELWRQRRALSESGWSLKMRREPVPVPARGG